ncbi:MAG: AbrB family transcriptional regulator, partial [Pseudomonadota bacterium]
KPLYALSLATLGASVGLAITPDVAAAMIAWAPAMVVAAALGMVAAIVMTPVLAGLGKMGRSTAFFSLLPGGVIEMANVGDRFGADRTTVASLHAVRVGLVVGLLPLGLLAFGEPSDAALQATPYLPSPLLAAVICLGLVGGWAAAKTGLPAAWLLGALLLVGVVSSFGVFAGRMPQPLLAVVQVLVGISLGARFQRSRLSTIPRAVAAGLPVILIIMAFMASAAVIAGLVIPFALPTLILCFSIGGMAEMVLTAKAHGQNVALVAAFQAIRAVLVNAFAGPLWRRLAPSPNISDSPEG